jgi:hypothetical protein
MKTDYSAAVSRILGYTSTLSAGTLLIYYLVYHKVKRILKWVVVLAAIGAFFLIRYAGDLYELKQLLGY